MVILIFCFLLGVLWRSHSVYVGDTAWRMKKKFVALDRELVLDAINNVRRIEHFKEDYELEDGFHIGKQLVKIRSKFGRMVHLHALSHNHFDEYDQNKHVLHLVEVQHLGMDIDNLVQIILDYEWEDRRRKPLFRRPRKRRNITRTEAPTTGMKGPLRNRNVWRKQQSPGRNSDYGGFDSDIN